MTGREFLKKTTRLDPKKREEAAYQQIISGNIPSFMRKLKPIKIHRQIKGQSYNATIWVSSDYLSIGTDRDFIRIPMSPITAQKIATRWEFVLPTPKIVDAIYQQAEIKLKPHPLPPSPKMASNEYFERHETAISKTFKPAYFGKLIAGHKKDVVLSKRLIKQPKRVAIYGWHQPNGKPIQPLSLVHGIYYADYSHGIRFISKWITINNKTYAFQQVINHPVLSELISYEGAFGRTHVASAEKDSIDEISF